MIQAMAMIQRLQRIFGRPVNTPIEDPVNGTIEETVAQHRLALGQIDERLTDVENRLQNGEAKIDARLRALEYRKDVMSRGPRSADR